MTSIQAHNLKAAANWGSVGADYDNISQTIADAILHAVTRLDPRPGEAILDLATGTGYGARLLAKSGAKVTGADIADDLLNAARGFAERDGLPIRFVTDDAESLSFGNASFDGILSTFGVMFAPGQESAASELARVVKPGGRIVLSAWTRDSAIARMFSVMKPYLPTPPDPARPSPFAWGDREHVTHLLGGAFELRFEPAVTNAYFTTGAAAWEFMSRCYGPTKTLAASLAPDRREALRRDLAAFHDLFATEFGITMRRDYHLILGRRI